MQKIHLPYLSPEWFDFRRKHITGTDVPAILGLSKWSSPLEVWMVKTGKKIPEREETDAMIWGRHLEEACRCWTAEAIGHTIEPNKDTIYVHEELDWLCCTPDGFVVEKVGRNLLPTKYWEGKCPSVYSRDEWSGGVVPKYYGQQVQIGLEITGLTEGILSALISPELKWGVVGPDPNLERTLETLTNFWEHHVQRDVPPAASASDRDTLILRELHPADDGEVVALSPKCIAASNRLDWLEKQRSLLKEQRDLLRNMLRQEIGDHSFAALPAEGGWAYTRDSKGRRALRRVERIPQVEKKA